MKTLLAAVIAVSCLMPAASFAGDKEWATAGKILTGIVGLQFLQNAHSSHRHSSYQRQNTYQRHNYSSSRSCQTPRYSYHAPPSYRYQAPPSHVHQHTTTIVHGSNCGCSSCRPVVQRSTTRIYSQAVPTCGNPVILEVNNTRRIFQPRIKGHVAYLQVYDQGNWITLREYPSVY